MLYILSQNKDFIVNMWQIISVEIVEEKNKYKLIAYLNDSMELELAVYDSLKRATHILNEMAKNTGMYSLPE